FPDILATRGFDIVLGNPPWEVMQVSEDEYFAQRLPDIVELPAAARKRAIALLESQNPVVYATYQSDKRRFEAMNEFARSSGRFNLAARGKINTYALFGELVAAASPRGRAGLIVPTQICTSDTTKQFFEMLLTKNRLASFLSFTEIRQWFPATDDRNPFGLLTLGTDCHAPEFAFFLTEINQLTDANRRFKLTTEDIARINPDTKTAPIFRAHADADLAAKLYRTANCSERPIAWITLKQNVFTSSSQPDLVEFSRPKSIDQDLIAIFRGAMLHQYDSRFATYINGDFEEVECSSKVPDYIARSDKYVSSTYYHTRMKTKNIRNAYHLSIRRIARATDERTMIAAMLPMVGT